MKILRKESSTEIEIKKSKFICHVKPVYTEEEAKNFVSEIKKKHRKATHNVPIYLLGENYQVQKYSDDGEPTGTAGLPVMRMMIKEEVSNVALVITRYFGGIKLGKGGLVRAYTNSAKEGLKASGLSEVLKFNLIEFELGYDMQNRFLYEFEKKFVYYEKEILYNDKIRYSYYLPDNQVASFEYFMINLTLGNFSFINNIKVEGILLDGKIEEVSCIKKF